MSDIGPLPQSDNNAALQRESIKALHAFLLDCDYFIVRDERVEDYGVDLSLEIKVGNSVTNIRAQVQMKATTHTEANQDGSISLSVATSNLNYLLNGPSPVYILYDDQLQEFWFTWAHKELRRLVQESPNWKGQRYVTVKFNQKLTKAGLSEIHAQILAEGRLHRQIHETLARATISEQVIISIQGDLSSFSDAVSVRNLLLASGPALVASGHAKDIIRLYGIVSLQDQSFARIQLTVAYAEFMCGHYYNSIGHISRALTRNGELADHDRAFLLLLQDICKFRSGLTDLATYQTNLKQHIAETSGSAKIEIQIENVKYELFKSRNREERKHLAGKLADLLQELENSPIAVQAVKLNARLSYLYAEGTEATEELMHYAGLIRMRANTQSPVTPEISDAFSRAKVRLHNWEHSADSALKEAYDLKHPILIADAIVVKATVAIFQLINQRFDAIFEGQVYKVTPQVMLSIQQILKEAAKLYERAGIQESVTRMRLLEADLLEIDGKIAEAKTIAMEVLPIVEAMNYEHCVVQARALIEDRTHLMDFEREWNNFKATDQDISFASLTDDQVENMARCQLEYENLPKNRLPVMIEHVKNERSIAKERIAWCKHIQVLEDLSQTRNPSIAFTVLPNRKCICEKYKYRTHIISSDAGALISAMKQTHCAVCTNREPKLP